MKLVLNSLNPALFMIIMLIVSLASAQPYTDLFNARTQFFGQTPYNDNSNNKLSVKQYGATFLLPMVQKNNDVILFGGDFTQTNFSVTGENKSNSFLYSASLAAGIEKHWKNQKWKTLFLFLPKLNADRVSFDNKNFQPGGILLFSRKKTDRLNLHFGVYYNHECFGHYLIPLLGLDWHPNERLNIWGDLPAGLNMEYKINRFIYTGASYLSITGSYARDVQGEAVYVRDGDKNFGHNQFKGFVNFYLNKHLVWFAEGGHTFGRMYQQYDYENQPILNETLFRKTADGWFFNTGMAFRFRNQ